MSITDDIRSSAAWVIDQASHVRINYQKIDAYSQFLLEKYPLISELDPANHLASDDPEIIAAYVMALDSINFGSAYYAEAQKVGVYIEYDIIASSLKAAFEAGSYRTPESWTKITPDDCHDLFSIPRHKLESLDELMHLFSDHLQLTGAILTDEHQSSALSFLRSANNSAVTLAGKLAQWKNFKDISVYRGRFVPIMKRAQIMAADLHLAFRRYPEYRFHDIHQITSFADNIVPHVLRHDEILVYTKDLDQKITDGVLIPSGAEEEVEMRCAAIHTVELLTAAAHRHGHEVVSMNLDHLLWHRGHEPEIYKYPSHRTKGIFY